MEVNKLNINIEKLLNVDNMAFVKNESIVSDRSTVVIDNLRFENIKAHENIDNLDRLKKNPDYSGVMKFTSKDMRLSTKENIEIIKDKDRKLADLKKTFIDGNWNAPLFDKLHLGLERVFEFPFIALYGLKNGTISEQEFFIVEMYYGMRTRFAKKDIKFHQLFNGDGEINEPNKKLLKDCLCENLIIDGENVSFSHDEFDEFISQLKKQGFLHEMCFFSTPDQSIGDERSVWDGFRGVDDDGMPTLSIFNDNDWQYTPSLIMYQCFLRILFPHSSDATVRARIGTTPPVQQAQRAKGIFDVLTPVPTCFPKEVDGEPAPGVDGVYHDLLGHAVSVFGVPTKWREHVYALADRVHDFERTYQIDETNQKLRHAFSHFIYDLDNLILSIINRNRKLTIDELQIKIDRFKIYLGDSCYTSFINVYNEMVLENPSFETTYDKLAYVKAVEAQLKDLLNNWEISPDF